MFLNVSFAASGLFVGSGSSSPSSDSQKQFNSIRLLSAPPSILHPAAHFLGKKNRLKASPRLRLPSFPDNSAPITRARSWARMSSSEANES